MSLLLEMYRAGLKIEAQIIVCYRMFSIQRFDNLHAFEILKWARLQKLPWYSYLPFWLRLINRGPVSV